MGRIILILVAIMLALPAHADIASTAYVGDATATKVDTAPTAKQTMAGEYTVSGALIVPTQPLPSAE